MRRVSLVVVGIDQKARGAAEFGRRVADRIVPTYLGKRVKLNMQFVVIANYIRCILKT